MTRDEAFIGLVLAYEQQAASFEYSDSCTCIQCGVVLENPDCRNGICQTCQGLNWSELKYIPGAHDHPDYERTKRKRETRIERDRKAIERRNKLRRK